MIIGEIYFDKYKVVDLLGQGGMSRVYLVENVRLGNEWAIKEVSKDTKGIEILAEAEILKKLNHPAIPKIIDIEDDETNVYIIEEYIEGFNLKTYKIKEEYLSEEQIINWGIQLAEVILYLHLQKPSPIIFRDIKPNNIIITNSNHIKLVDFGIAREYKPGQEKDTMPLGSRGYAAPEQYGGQQSDERTDIFALGVTLHFLATGQNLGEPPYVLNFSDDELKQLSKPFRGLIAKCCEPISENRYQSIEEILGELKSLQREHINSVSISKKKHIKLNIKEETLKLGQLHKTFNIGITGVAYGVGSTHTAIMIATALAKYYSVALVNMDHYESFSEILLNLDDKRSNKNRYFQYRKVCYFWDQDYEEFRSKENDKYDFIIWDFGDSILNNIHLKDYLRSDIHLVIAQGIDWKVKELLEFYEDAEDYDEKHRWKYIIPFLEKNELSDMRTYIESSVYSFPFHRNPFKVNKEIIKKVRLILMD